MTTLHKFLVAFIVTAGMLFTSCSKDDIGLQRNTIIEQFLTNEFN